MSASSPQTNNSTDEDQCAQERRLKPLRCSSSRSRSSRSRSRSRRSRSSYRPSRSSLRPKEASCHSIDFQCCPAWTCQTLPYLRVLLLLQCLILWMNNVRWLRAKVHRRLRATGIIVGFGPRCSTTGVKQKGSDCFISP